MVNIQTINSGIKGGKYVLENIDLLGKIEKLGVNDPVNLTEKEMKIVLDAYLKDKKLDQETFQKYMNTVPQNLKTIISGLEQFSKDNKDVSSKCMEIINKTINIYGDELKRDDLSSQERSDIRDQILKCMYEARTESQESRTFGKSLAATVGGVAVISFGILVFMLTKGRNQQVIKEGLQIITKVI